MCAAGLDFSESEVYDFARCLMPNGETYGVSDDEACKVGRRIGDKEKTDKNKSGGRFANLKREFIKKTGREMTKEEQAKLAIMLGSKKGKRD